MEGHRHEDLEQRDVSRIRAFTDGVMAVAITLLVLNIEVPDLPTGSEGRLDEELVDLLPSLGAYALSFALVGRYWVVHHRMFEDLRSFDGTLMALNLLFLALIGLVPFASNLVDRYDEEPIAAAVFAGTLGLAAMVNTIMVRYIRRRGFAPAAEEANRVGGMVSLAIAVAFLLSIPAAFLSLTLARLIWLSVFLVRRPVRLLGRR
jgi:uncharacterized membrane protein